MVINIPTIQPFTYQASTAFQERVQLADKLNEVIDALNQIEDIEDLQTQIDTINGTITQIQADIANNDTEISGIQSQVNTLIQEVNGLLSEVVNEIVVDSPGYGQVRVKLIHEDESETTSNALQIPVIQDGGITLISGTTDRSFKIQYVTMDGVTHTTNDFVIPEGGGTDVTVTSISILQGDTDNDIKFQVGLSDGSTIQSNSYPIPEAAITPATTSQIGGIKVGTNLSVTANGTLSVDMTTIGKAAKADSIMWTADASKVTLHADSLNGSDFTEDIPQAAQGGAGTIDHASYQKIAANESAISKLKTDVAALAPTVSVNEEVDPPTITIGINGKTAQANLPSGGKQLVTSGNLDDFININTSNKEITVNKEIDLEYIVVRNGGVNFSIKRITISKGTIKHNATGRIQLYHTVMYTSNNSANAIYVCYLNINLNNGGIMLEYSDTSSGVILDGNLGDIKYTETIEIPADGVYYRLYA